MRRTVFLLVASGVESGVGSGGEALLGTEGESMVLLLLFILVVVL